MSSKLISRTTQHVYLFFIVTGFVCSHAGTDMEGISKISSGGRKGQNHSELRSKDKKFNKLKGDFFFSVLKGIVGRKMNL